MSTVGAVPERSERPAYVRFERVAVEDKQGTLKAGHYVGRDVEYALITPPYSKDVVRKKVPEWFDQMEANVRNGRLPQEWVDNYRKAYQAWRNGQELPPNGTPIRGWPVISPAQMEKLLSINILTVEDLAGVNDEGAKRIGMGSLDLKNKAVAWLAQRTDKGPLTIEIADLKNQNATLRASVDSMKAQLEALSAQMKTTSVLVDKTSQKKSAIRLNDILPDGDVADDTKE